MSTLLNGGSAVWRKTAKLYGILAVFFGIFAFVYLQFSHGESSPFLIWLFLPSLVLGMIPAIIVGRMVKPKHRPAIAVRRLWNSAIATLSAGMLVRAIINISGRFTEYDSIYWFASGLLVLAASVSYIKQRSTLRQTQKPQASEIEVY